MADTRVEAVIVEQSCRELVERIVNSNDFRRARRLRDFLSYVVDRKFAGTAEELTEAQIGQRVFHRPATYNPAEDSIVRTEARNLRQRLERYFAGAGLGEPILLEIPKGGYTPVFRFREAAAAPGTNTHSSAGMLRSRRYWLLGAGGLAGAAAIWRASVAGGRGAGEHAPAGSAATAPGRVEFDASDVRLVKGLEWARRRALECAYSGDAVGQWYDSTAGTRYAFCMRDVSHQRVGASVLGLWEHTRNMLRRFAGSMAATRDWCGFWEINKDGFPAPIDYQDDTHFWYCLPANFDLMRACYREYLWTGDQTYFDAVFSNFYDRSVTSYVGSWDRDRDGVMESPPEAGRRGIPSYYQHEPRPLTGADLVAAQYQGYLAYAAIQRRKGAQGSLSEKLAAEYLEKARALRARFDADWWNRTQKRYYQAMLPDRSYYGDTLEGIDTHILWFGIAGEGFKTEATLDILESNGAALPQVLSYFPEILFRHGRHDSAYRFLLQIMDAEFAGRGMPEVAYAAIGAAATGLAGIATDAPSGMIETLPRLPKALEWITVRRVPVIRNEISVRHRSHAETQVINQAGPPLRWRARFPAGRKAGRILVDGQAVATSLDSGIISAVVPVKSGQARTAQYLSGA